MLNHLPADSSRIGVLEALVKATRLNELDSAFVYAQQLYDLTKTSSNGALVARAEFYMGMVRMLRGQYAEALPYYQRALHGSELLDDPDAVAMIQGVIGEIFLHLNDPSRAKGILIRSYQGYETLGKQMWKAGSAETLGAVYLQQHKYDSAYYYFNEAAELLSASGVGQHAIHSRIGLAEALSKMGEDERADSLYREVLNDQDPAGSQIFDCVVNMQKGKTNERFHRFAEAKRAYMVALNIAMKKGFDSRRAEAHQALGRVYQHLGQPDSALIQLQLFIEWNDLLTSRSMAKFELEAAERYEAAKKDAELGRQAAVIAKQSSQLVIYLAVSGLLLASAVLLFLSYRRKQKVNRTLQERNQLTEQTLKEKELLLSELHHRVKNNMQTVSSLLRMQSRSVTDEPSRQTLQEAMMRVKSMALIHQDLYHGNALDRVPMDDYIAKLAGALVKSHGMKERVKLKIDIDRVDLTIDSAVPLGLILNELITNALKHAFPNERIGMITVRLQDRMSALTIEVTDDGVGYEPAREKGDIGSLGSGSDIVSTFAETLNADWSVVDHNGTSVRLNVQNFVRA